MRVCPQCHEEEPDSHRRHCGYCDWPLGDDAEFEASRADYRNDLEKEERHD